MVNTSNSHHLKEHIAVTSFGQSSQITKYLDAGSGAVGKTLQFILLQNKHDIENCVDSELISKFMESESLISMYFEVSCLSGDGIPELQFWIVDDLSE
jgi:hypothetical protein